MFYHYAGNNPVKYTDPDGRDHGIPSDIQKHLDERKGGLPYEPGKWNLNPFVLLTTNCYAYAMDLQKNPLNGKLFTAVPDGYCLQPGDLANIKNVTYNDYIKGNAANVILNNVKADASVAGFTFAETTIDANVKQGNWKVALVISPEVDIKKGIYPDYHWYRQNSDGTWSHKAGTTKVTNKDASGEIIYNPQKANMDTRKFYDPTAPNYTLFIGFFEVSKCSIEN